LAETMVGGLTVVISLVLLLPITINSDDSSYHA